MACITLVGQPMAMATMQLARAIPRETVCWQTEAGATRSTLRMNWVVVTDSEDHNRLRTKWLTDGDP